MNLANGITMSSILMGVVSVLLLQTGNETVVFVLFPVILLLDKLDGMAARKFDCSSPIGAQLDSLSDALNFGVVISLFLFSLSNQAIAVGIASILYNACAFWRLARFNAEDGHSHSFRGLPTTNAAAWLFVFSGVSVLIPGFHAEYSVVPMIVLSALMVGNFRYHNSSILTLLLYPAVPIAALLLFWWR